MEGLGAATIVGFVALIITALGMKKKADDAYIDGLIARVDKQDERLERQNKEIEELKAEVLACHREKEDQQRQIWRLFNELEELKRGAN